MTETLNGSEQGYTAAELRAGAEVADYEQRQLLHTEVLVPNLALMRHVQASCVLIDLAEKALTSNGEPDQALINVLVEQGLIIARDTTPEERSADPDLPETELVINSDWLWAVSAGHDAIVPLVDPDDEAGEIPILAPSDEPPEAAQAA